MGEQNDAAGNTRSAVDPVCGMTLDPAKSAGTAEYRGITYYFCNPRCRERFTLEPARYVSSHPPGSSAGAAVEPKDPVCGMTVEPSKAAGMHEHAGKLYHFCSRSCLDKFRSDPARYTGSLFPVLPSSPPAEAPRPARLPAETEARTFVCPMDGDVRQRGPGACPKCGMALEPELPGPAETQWTCPMHPEIVRDQPGSCPICGMALEPAARGAGRGGEPRTDRHDPSVLGQRRALAPGARSWRWRG